MIKSIEIQNFQSHENSVLEFHPGVNIIVGSSDSGKTAIKRALRKLIYNRPLGDAFRSNWGGDTQIIVKLDDKEIKYHQNNSGNKYVIGSSEFKAIGTGVPEEVSKILNIADINIQSQLDGPFLLTSTSGEVAVHFNRIARIDQIDSALKKVRSWITSLQQGIKADETQASRYKDQLKDFEHLDKFEVDVEVLEEMEKRKETTAQQKSKLTTLITSISTVTEEIKQASGLLPLQDEVTALLQLHGELERKNKEQKTLQTTITELRTVTDSIEEQNDLISDEGVVNTVLELYREKEEKQKHVKALSTHINNIQTTLTNHAQAVINMNTMETKFHAEFPDVCPLCGVEKLKK